MREIQFVNIIQLILVFQSIFFSLFLFSNNKGKRTSNVLLGLFLLVLACHMGLNYVFETGISTFMPDITSTLGFLYGPFIYLFIKSQIYKELKFNFSQLLHFVPWSTAMVVIFTLDNFSTSIGISILMSFSMYLFFSFKALRNYKKVLSQTQTNYGSIAMNWINQLLYLMVAITIIDIVRNGLFSNSEIFEALFYVLLVCSLLVFVITLVFKGLKQPELFQGITEDDEAIFEAIAKPRNTSELSDYELRKIANDIQQFMLDVQPFLNPDLTLNELAQQLSVSSRILSQAINYSFEKNFSEYINEFRIEEAKKQLIGSIDDGKTVLEIAYASGFNSKSNFYAAFKHIMNITPSQFKANINSK